MKDLLAAIHQYTADFYDKEGLAEVASRQFYETALLAMGIVVEELVREYLGDEGHKMFLENALDVEGEDDSGDVGGEESEGILQEDDEWEKGGEEMSGENFDDNSEFE